VVRIPPQEIASYVLGAVRAPVVDNDDLGASWVERADFDCFLKALEPWNQPTFLVVRRNNNGER